MTLTDFFGNGCSDVRWRCGERIPWLAMTGTRYCGMTVKVVRRSHSSDNSPASTRRPAAMPYRGKVREVLQWTQANGALRDMVCRPGLPFIFLDTLLGGEADQAQRLSLRRGKVGFRWQGNLIYVAHLTKLCK